MPAKSSGKQVRYLPRTGTAAYNAMVVLNDKLGRSAKVTDIIKLITWKQSIVQFQQAVIERLGELGFVTLAADVCTLTPAGLDFLGAPMEPPAVEVQPTPVAPATREFKPLNVARMRPAILPREGSPDMYRVESRHSSTGTVRRDTSLAFLAD